MKDAITNISKSVEREEKQKQIERRLNLSD